MITASPLSQQAQAETGSPSPSWGLALTGAIGSGKTTVAQALAALLGWRLVGSGDVARSIDANTAATGAMADPDALDAALRPLLVPSPVVLDGYPRTARQLAGLPRGFDVVTLQVDRVTALARANRAAKQDGKEGWNAEQRYRDQMGGLEDVARYSSIIVDARGKTVGDVVFEILSSPWIGPPTKRP